MAKYDGYEIVIGDSPQNLEEQVVMNYLMDGWELIGGVTYGKDGDDWIWAQAVAK